MMSASSSSPDVSPMPVGVNRLDGVGDDRGPALAQRAEQVAVGHHAEPLVPRVVARLEVHVDVDVAGSCARAALRTSRLTSSGRRRASWKVADAAEDVGPAHERDRRAASAACAAGVANGSRAGRETTYVGDRCSIVTWPAVVGQRRHQRDRRGAAADDHDLLAGVVEVLGPVLGVDDRALEVVGARELRARRARRSRSSRRRPTGSSPSSWSACRRVVDLDGPAARPRSPSSRGGPCAGSGSARRRRTPRRPSRR